MKRWQSLSRAPDYPRATLDLSSAAHLPPSCQRQTSGSPAAWGFSPPPCGEKLGSSQRAAPALSCPRAGVGVPLFWVQHVW